MHKPIRIYLASPYAHEYEWVRWKRYEQVKIKTALLMAAGYVVFSPIVHSHNLVENLPGITRDDLDFWMKQDTSYIRIWANELWVFCLPGWQRSLGISREIANAFDVNIPVKLLRPNTDIPQEEL